MHFDIEICYKNNCKVFYENIVKVEFKDFYIVFDFGLVCKERKG